MRTSRETALCSCRRRIAGLAALAVLTFGAVEAQHLAMPVLDKGIKFAVIGDTGTGTSSQREVAALLTKYRGAFPFDFVIMLGDNIYGGESPRDFRNKFELPYQPLLDAGVKFYAALGNHDLPNQRFYKPFNMGEKRYYSFGKGDVKFFVIDSTYVDPAQVKWLEAELRNSREPWKICYFHHPIYSSGARHGSDLDLRAKLEPLFVAHGVDVVFAGHEHFYERLKPQKGIHYFVQGASAKLRKGNIGRGAMTAAGFDQDMSFTIVAITGDDLYFQTISRAGRTVDSGTLKRREKALLAARKPS